jgi:hypothetical protein
MTAELGDLAGGLLAYVNSDPYYDYQGPGENYRNKPRGNMSNPQGTVERAQAFDRFVGVQENFHNPGDQDEKKNKNLVPFQTPPDRFEHADFEGRENQVFTDQLFPFALKQVAIFHHHRHEEMRLKHADAGAEGIVKAVTPRLDPKHDPDNREVEKEDQVRHAGVGKRDRDNCGAARYRPVRRGIESSAPDHDTAKLAAIKMRHRVDVALVVKAALDGVRRFVGRSVSFVCHAGE